MVSMGTDAARALSNMVRKVALELRSPPPSRAATSSCRINLANTLARALSTAALRCLVVAHFEWPDIATVLSSSTADASPFDHRQEQPVQAAIPGELGVERRHQHLALAAHDGSLAAGDPALVGNGGEHLGTGSDPVDARRPDEHGVHGA